MSWIKKIIPSCQFMWLGILSAVLVGLFLAQDEFLRAWDAYYYALKIKGGVAAFADGNLVYLLERPFMWLGLNAENAHRAWVTFSVLLFLFSLAAVLKPVKNQPIAWLLFGWALLSPSLIYIAVSFPKMFVFLICFNWVFLYTLQKPFHPIAWGIWTCAAFLFHKTAVFYLAICAGWLLWQHFRQGDKKILYTLALTAAGVGALLAFKPFSVGMADWMRLDLSSLKPGVLDLLSNFSIQFILRMEIFCALCLTCFLLLRYRQTPRILPVPLLFLAVSFCPAFSSEVFSLGGRLGLLFPYFCLMACVWIQVQGGSKAKPLHISRTYMGMLVLLLLVGSVIKMQFSLPKVNNWRYHRYEQAIGFLQEKDLPMLIASKQFAYFYKFHTGKNSFYFAPPPHWDPTLVYRLLEDIDPFTTKYFLPKQCEQPWEFLPFEDIAMLLIREDCYQQFVKKIPKETSLWLMLKNGPNPWQQRPDFLSNKHCDNQTDPLFPACAPKP